MKPGRRRLLIPGLLITLLVIVALAAAVRRAEAETPLPPVASQRVSTITDPRIQESSGIAASRQHPGLAYTINDSGNAPEIFTIEISSGRVVGVTTVTNVTWRDTEAMALWNGQLFIADTGNNNLKRTDLAIYVIDEPGTGSHAVEALWYPVTFEGEPIDVESMAVVPGRIDLFAKGWPVSVAYELTGVPVPGHLNVARRTKRPGPALMSDATATADGRLELLRGATVIEVRDARTWQLRHTDVAPPLQQGESITVEASGTSYLLGSEGTHSPVLRVAFDPARVDSSGPIDEIAQLKAEHPWRYQYYLHLTEVTWAVAAVGLAAVVGATLWWRRRRRRRVAWKSGPSSQIGREELGGHG